MNLTIDIGNTRTKIALFDGETFVREEKFENTDAEHLLNVVKEKEAEGLAFCSVAAENPLLVEALKQLPYPVLEVKGTTPAPVTVAYRTPETLGADRLAAVVGAVTLKPQTDLLVVDAGTCITYDLLMPQETTSEETFRQALKCDWKRCTTAPPACHGLKPTETPPTSAMTPKQPSEQVWCAASDMNCKAASAIGKKTPRLTHFPHRRRPLHFQRCTAKNILTDSHLVARGLNKLLLNYMR